MDFVIESNPANVTDAEIVGLLTKAYVEGGFTSPERAALIFVPSSVRGRGEMICARAGDGVFAGMVIVVRPDAQARRLAESDEAEIHLLAVAPQFHAGGM